MSTDTPSATGDGEPMSEEALQERIEELEEQVASLETAVGDGLLQGLGPTTRCAQACAW